MIAVTLQFLPAGHCLRAGDRGVRRPDRDLPACAGDSVADGEQTPISSPAPSSLPPTRAIFRFGIRDLLVVTVLQLGVRLVLAVPVSVGIAIYLTQYAPTRLARIFSGIVDVLAAVPLIVFTGCGESSFSLPSSRLSRRSSTRPWAGSRFSLPATYPLPAAHDLHGRDRARRHDPADYHRCHPRGLPADSRQARSEAAETLGATKWEVIRMTVLPFRCRRRRCCVRCSVWGGRSARRWRCSSSCGRPQKRRIFRLFDGGFSFASKIASAAAEFSTATPHGRLYRGRVRALRVDLRRQRGRPEDRWRGGARMTSDVDVAGQSAVGPSNPFHLDQCGTAHEGCPRPRIDNCRLCGRRDSAAVGALHR